LLKNAQGEIEPQEVPSRHELTDGDALLDACLAGCGLAQLPTWLAGDALHTGALTQVFSDISGGAMPIHVIWQKTWHLQPRVRVTVDELVRLAARDRSVFCLSKQSDFDMLGTSVPIANKSLHCI
jgi:DNA-binding transcriptional LysR family regulator